jgi:hypothetical protein
VTNSFILQYLLDQMVCLVCKRSPFQLFSGLPLFVFLHTLIDRIDFVL